MAKLPPFVPIARKAFRPLDKGGDVFWNEPRVFSRWEAWEDLIVSAARKPIDRVVKRRNRPPVIVHLERGEVLGSVRFYAERWRWAPARVERFLTLLSQKLGRIERKTETPAGTVYLLVNFGVFNFGETPDETAARQQRDSSETAARQNKRSNKRSKKKETYIIRCAEMWEQVMGGPIAFGRIGKAFKPLVEKHGEAEVVEYWQRYLTSTREAAKYKTPERFAERYGAWKAQRATGGPTVDDVLRAIDAAGLDIWYPDWREEAIGKIAEKDKALALRTSAFLRSLDWKYLHGVKNDRRALERAIAAALEVGNAA